MLGEAYDYPRSGVRTVIGLDSNDNPIIVMVNMERGVVFHVSRFEKKYEWMLWRQPCT